MKEYYNKFCASTPVAIPIIQRDYVQGANINFEKRDRFIKSILDSLLEDGSNFEIDFIYGSSDFGGRYFQPIDGQQRLTTIALVAWSLNNKSGGQYSDKLPELTYFTRPSSEQFTRNLFCYSIGDTNVTISEYLKTVPGWFSQNWVLDPSIKAMLEMLDKIDSLLSDTPYAAHIRTMAERFFAASPINFELLDMKELNLTDDLYIKMNARGKMLTPFENWKAGFEGLLNRKYSNVDYLFGSVPGDDGKEKQVSVYEYFVYAVEHEWCNLLWPNAYKRWSDLPDNEKRKSTYPRIDEDFMRLLDFISRFLFFSQTSEKEPKKEHYESDKDRKREVIYSGSQTNVETLMRMLDILVKLQNTGSGIDAFFAQIFTHRYDPDNKRVLLIGDNEKIDLYQLCLDDKLNYNEEILFWALLKYLMYHPDTIGNADDNLRDYLRIIAGWISTLSQRLVNGLNVNPNIRLSHFSDAEEIIDLLASSDDIFGTLAKTTQRSLEPERRKAMLVAEGKYDIIRILSTQRELYYCFNLLYDSIDATASVQEYVSRFEEFIKLNDVERIRSLVKHGYCGVPTMRNHYFYGLEGKWDFVFTIPDGDSGYASVRKAFTDLMLNAEDLVISPDCFAYYIITYDEFLNAVNDDERDYSPVHYFIRDDKSQYVAWAVKTMSSRPIMGFNVDPFGYAVSYIAEVTGDSLYLVDKSYYGETGRLYLQQDSDHVALVAECCEQGWHIEKFDKRFTCIQSMLSRFQFAENESGEGTFIDTKGEYEFKGMTLLDKPDVDRIQIMVRFLETFA